MKITRNIITVANVIERIIYASYKQTFTNLIAKYILRLSRFVGSTNPLVPFMLIMGAIIGAMCSTFQFNVSHVPSKFNILFGAVEYSVALTLISYVIWEIYRAWLFLVNWAEDQNR